MSQRSVKNHKTEVSAVRHAARTFLESVAPAMEDKLRLFLGDGEHLPDLGGLARLILRCVEWRFETLERAECAKLAAEGALSVSRRRRDTACRLLRAALRQLRDLTRAVTRRRGGGWAPMFLFPPIPSDPVGLLRFVGRVCEELRELSSEPLLQGGPVTFDPLKLAAELDQGMTLLDQALKEICAGEHKLTRARCDHDDAKAGFEADSAAGLRLLSALGRYAGSALLTTV